LSLHPAENVKSKSSVIKAAAAELFEQFSGKAHGLVISNLRWLNFAMRRAYLLYASVLANGVKTTVLCPFDNPLNAHKEGSRCPFVEVFGAAEIWASHPISQYFLKE
jgi:hypothetical protein